MLATAPPILTPGLITPDPSVEPRFGFKGDMPDPDNRGAVLVLPFFFFSVALLGIWLFDGIPAVEGAELNVCEGEEKCTDEPDPRSPELSCRRAFSCRAWTDRKSSESAVAGRQAGQLTGQQLLPFDLVFTTQL